ncbi:GNAT family N-acetyltransferase [Macrococcus carouselicus]|uniref:N-acetyltransferase n=1 Tax=Macrococcus carouselicus TaxID=69969 RepID=A0A9Q8FQ76_9STAP|nr:GNAT family protein [Macrococcus carouselicus]TDM02222.1 N-acetyltransferase [Macrococcus carouselicus]
MLSYKVDDEIELALPRPEIDGPVVYRLIDKQRDYLKEFLPWLDHLQNEEEEIIAFKEMMKNFGAGKSVTLVIHYQQKAAGMIDFHNINPSNRSADIGYWLSEDLQGKGIMTRAVTGMCSLGFNSFNFNRITLTIECDNLPSQKVAERSGFMLEGKLRSYLKNRDDYKDAYFYSLLKHDGQSS